MPQQRGRKPVYAKIRIEGLERAIGTALARKDYNASEALRGFARQAGIRLNEETIQDQQQKIETELSRYK